MTVRRVGDIVLSLILLTVCLPTVVMVGIAVWLEQASAPFFRQERMTRDGKTVRVYRVRTSRPTHFGPRITPLGDFLRKMHLDEIPQLFNVLNGDLSLVGRQPAFIDDIGRKKVFALREP
jgi:lipopolysaccharide/colanic/teichoic acid biosynthesis glycosyltransferase